MWDLVRTPEDRFSHNKAHLSIMLGKTGFQKSSDVEYSLPDNSILTSLILGSPLHTDHLYTTSVQWRRNSHLKLKLKQNVKRHLCFAILSFTNQSLFIFFMPVLGVGEV